MTCLIIKKRYHKQVPNINHIIDSLEKKGRVITNRQDARYLGYIFKTHKKRGIIFFNGKGRIMLNPEYTMRRRNKKIIEIIRDVTTKP